MSSVSSTNNTDTSTDPKWEQAQQIREEGYKKHVEAQDHLDNATSAAGQKRIFEATRQITEAASSLVDANKDYSTANRLENEAAQDAARLTREKGGCILC